MLCACSAIFKVEVHFKLRIHVVVVANRALKPSNVFVGTLSRSIHRHVVEVVGRGEARRGEFTT